MKKAILVGLVLSLVFGVNALGFAASGNLEDPISKSTDLVVTVGKWAELTVDADSLTIDLTAPGDSFTRTTSVHVKTNTGVDVTLTSPGELVEGDLSWEENAPDSALEWFLSFSSSDRDEKSYALTPGSTDTRTLYFYAKWNDAAAEWWKLRATSDGYRGTAVVTVAAK
ncbi:MAG: hypothetical protein GX986_11425 [Firmicutes bacterium]|nr:hypothetical protein [Bacillota bacterium]